MKFSEIVKHAVTLLHESRRTTRVELTAAGRVLAEEGGARSWQ